jgi:hypothetical protein
MSKTVEKMAASGELSAEEIERIGRNVSDFIKAAEQDPALFEEAVEKLAFLEMEKVPWKQVGGTLLAAGAIDLGARAASDIYSGVKGAIQKARGYKSMLLENEDLAKADPKVVQRAYNTLHKFNPHYADDPLVAGQFVRSVVETSRVPMDAINQLVQSRKNIGDTKGYTPFGNQLPVNLIRFQDQHQMAQQQAMSPDEIRSTARAQAYAGWLRNKKEIDEAGGAPPGMQMKDPFQQP